jgi:Zinc carboxypeptidase
MNELFRYFPNVNFSQRYLAPKDLHDYLLNHQKQYICEIGRSAEGLPIYMFTRGTGLVKILAWSQMHGNESTASLAMLDLLYSLEKDQALEDRLFSAIALDFIFMLNPDGSQAWTRRNAQGIDINRDFLQAASPEMNILKQQIAAKNYDYALNLHDQRSIFSVAGEAPATLAFLSPSQDEARSLTPTRQKSMAIIAYIYQQLQDKIPGQIARFSDEFYPRAVGDNLSLMGLPTILFEAGHFPQDYTRAQTRQYFCYALFYAFSAMMLMPQQSIGYEQYFEIPENQESHFDLIYRQVNIGQNTQSRVDIAIQYAESLDHETQQIILTSQIAEIGDCSHKKGWQEIDASQMQYHAHGPLQLGGTVNFELKA